MPDSIVLSIATGRQRPAPASAALMEALRELEIERSDRVPSGFQITLASALGDQDDHPLLAGGELEPNNRMQFSVAVDGTTKLLLDGFITERELAHDPASGGSRLFVRGEDLSLRMGQVEISQSYPEMTDSQIVQQILGRYAALGVSAEVTAPADEQTPERQVPQQLGSDLAMLLRLAERHDRCFYLKPGPDAGRYIAYWGPQEVDLTPQEPALTAPGAPETNLLSLDGAHDALAGELSYGQRLADGSGGAESEDADIAASRYGSSVSMAARQPPLQDASGIARDPPSFAQDVQGLAVRGRFVGQAYLGPAAAADAAEARTRRAAARALELTGELDTLRYGAVLEAPGVVGLRGAGSSLDGLYYVQQVRHCFRFEPGTSSYTQRFTLTREGVGATRDKV